jgi:hypothetical protein
MWFICFLNKEKFESFIFAADGCYTDILYIRIDKFFNNLDNNAAAFPILMARSLIFYFILRCISVADLIPFYRNFVDFHDFFHFSILFPSYYYYKYYWLFLDYRSRWR